MSGESLVCKDLNIPSMPTDSPLQAFYLLIFNQLCLSERACPDILAEEIIDNIETGLANFRQVAAKLATN
ncbi:hypothetical protein [Rubritalea tangerina]|uniref:hypothetical protein n=2 Tax=Rubritalea tangerina TaxID=430798 RepID=UPI003606ED24